MTKDDGKITKTHKTSTRVLALTLTTRKEMNFTIFFVHAPGLNHPPESFQSFLKDVSSVMNRYENVMILGDFNNKIKRNEQKVTGKYGLCYYICRK